LKEGVEDAFSVSVENCEEFTVRGRLDEIGLGQHAPPDE
jgi:hypothetical protein